ncbi:MAG: HD domain-containing protein [Proteobacteria bacterium]|nr:HD domain-containing protein [Desulfobulbaceae bacterium]MBU4153922.1 HD domain-containing protein [Pseudomonadota bacterium]MDP2105164.1 HD domain-containing protein [Desulfobulbaceae bacterium]
MIPRPAHCLWLMDEYRMLPNIRAHSLVVARIAEFLALAMRSQGVTIDIELTVAAALMHDIAKSLCLESECNHALLGRDICLEHEMNEVAPLVAQHVVLSVDSFPLTPISAKEIVYYADKRVNHDQIVPLEERLIYILDRYGNGDPALHVLIRDNFERCLAIEQEIFQGLAFGPQELSEWLGDFCPSWQEVVPLDWSRPVGSRAEICQ